MSNNNPISAWDFVEKYYPNYSSSNEIAHSDDLQKLLDDEYEDGDHASNLLVKEYGGKIWDPQIIDDYRQSLMSIYEKSIENYLKINLELSK